MVKKRLDAACTNRRYTGQREVAAIGLYDYNARMYWPAAGRFVSADTVVPGPFSPQQYNRYLYVLGNPLRLVDPSGHVSAADCGAISDQAQSAFCWNQRWYEAHGYIWVNGGWQAGHDPIFGDAGIAMDVLGEAGITLESEAGLSWTDDMIRSAALGVVRLGQALAGGLGRVRELLGGGTSLHLRKFTYSLCGGGTRSCAPPGTNGGYLTVEDMKHPLGYMVVVHELAHVIDWNSSMWVGDPKGIRTRGHFSDGWNVYDPITDYAKGVRGVPIFGPTLAKWEKFAEAVAVAVFGQAYERWSGAFVKGVDWQGQSSRMLELLNGWR